MAKRRVSLLFLGNPELDRRIQSFAAMFRASGYEPHIFCTIPSSPTPRNAEGVTQLAQPHTSGPRMFLRHHSALRQKLTRIAEAEVIIACDLYSLRAGAQAKKRNPRSVLIYDARELYTGLPAVASRPFIRYFWKKWEAAGMLEADFVIVTAPHDADAIFRVHSFLPRPILIRNIPVRNEVEPNTEYLRSLGIRESDKVAVYVGGLQQDRGLEASIRAMAHCPEYIKLLLIGGGAAEGNLRSLAQSLHLADRIRFAGPHSHDRVMPILAACDVGLSLIETKSPSYELALPSKVFEYLHAGLPVISTELRHVVELFDHQPYISYVDAANERAIAEAITNTIGKKQDLKEAIAHAASQYSFESDFEKLRSLLEERLAERG